MKTAGSWKPIMLAGAGLLALSVWTSPAAAQHTCQGDAFRLCNEFIPDRGKVASCLFRNKRQLTPGCRAEIGGGTKVTRKAKHKRYGKRKRRR